MAPYQANKPQAADQMSISQGDLQNNFLALKALVDINHETFGSANEGKHTVIAFPQQTVSVVPPIFPPATTATEMALYTKDDGGTTHLFLRPTGQAAGIVTNDLNLTKSINIVPGYCILPCGIIIKWATSNNITQGATPNSVALYNGGVGADDYITTVLSVQITGNSADGQAILTYRGWTVLTQTVDVKYDRSFGAGNVTTCNVLVIGI